MDLHFILFTMINHKLLNTNPYAEMHYYIILIYEYN